MCLPFSVILSLRTHRDLVLRLAFLVALRWPPTSGADHLDGSLCSIIPGEGMMAEAHLRICVLEHRSMVCLLLILAWSPSDSERLGSHARGLEHVASFRCRDRVPLWCNRTSGACPCQDQQRRMVALRGGGQGAGIVSPGEGPRAPRLPDPPSLLDVVAGTGTEMSESDAHSDAMPQEDMNFRTELRRYALSPEEQEEFFAQLHNDSQWANVSLLPLFFGEETPEEIQWEQERQHGDLNLYRRSWVPTPKYLAWKAVQDKLAAERELARTEAIQSADEISMSSSATSDSEPNWFFTHTDEGDRHLMWRPAYGKHVGGGDAYVPLDVDRSELIDPGDMNQELPRLRFEWMGEDVQDIVDTYLNNEKSAMEQVLRDENKAREQMKKRSPREAECWRLFELVSALGQIPAVGLCIGTVRT